MLRFVLKRALWVIISLLALSLLTFSVGKLISAYGGKYLTLPDDFPPADCESGERYGIMVASGVHLLFGCPTEADLARARAFSDEFGLDRSFFVQYFEWVRHIVFEGNWGQSWRWHKPVDELIYERVALTCAIVLPALLVSWLLAVPLGTALAHRKGIVLDDLTSFVCRVSRCIPPFIIALVVMWAAMSAYERNMGGLFSEEYILAAWSWAKVADMLKHVWLPVLILLPAMIGHISLAVRGAILRELDQPYVDGARVRGVAESTLFKRYPLRIALGQALGGQRLALTRAISGTALLAMVMSLQTSGPMLLRAGQGADGYLVASLVLVLGGVSIIGGALVDVLRALLDPRSLEKHDLVPNLGCIDINT